MQGTVVVVAVDWSQEFALGGLIAVVEAMKTETAVHAAMAGAVHDVAVKLRDSVAQSSAGFIPPSREWRSGPTGWKLCAS
jgi:acetyl-CoA/propionyl-CoA carboxylase biotin carboxyl carrier protein